MAFIGSNWYEILTAFVWCISFDFLFVSYAQIYLKILVYLLCAKYTTTYISYYLTSKIFQMCSDTVQKWSYLWVTIAVFWINYVGNIYGVLNVSCFWWILQALTRLTKLYVDRAEAYASSDVKVSLRNISVGLGNKDVSHLSPTVIAIEALMEMSKLMTYRKLMNAAAGS